jgi:hypothetical protein
MNQQGGTDATCGEHAFMGGMRRLASIAPHQYQPATVTVSRVRFSLRCFPAVAHCRVTSRLFYTVCRGDLHRHRRLGFPSLGRAANLNMCAALLIGRSHQLYRISDKPGSDLAYPFHSDNPSSGVTFHAQEHEPKGVGSAQEVIGVYQHDHC